MHAIVSLIFAGMYRTRHLVVLSVSLFMAASSVTLYSSCIRDLCETVVCANGGICVNAECACASGYEGVRCNNKWNEKFEGKWNAEEVALRDTTIAGRHLFEMQVEGNHTKDSFYVAGFAGTAGIVQCSRTTYRTFTMVADQKLNDSFTLKNGSGVLDVVSGDITGSYTYNRRLAIKDTVITVNFLWKKKN